MFTVGCMSRVTGTNWRKLKEKGGIRLIRTPSSFILVSVYSQHCFTKQLLSFMHYCGRNLWEKKVALSLKKTPLFNLKKKPSKLEVFILCEMLVSTEKHSPSVCGFPPGGFQQYPEMLQNSAGGTESKEQKHSERIQSVWGGKCQMFDCDSQWFRGNIRPQERCLCAWQRSDL